jgi:hypothetical protein
MTTPPHDPGLIVPTDGWENNSWTNGDRADSARRAIEYFGQQRGMDTDGETLAIDLLTDILHFLHSKGIDPQKTVNMAMMHFEAETTG